MNDQFKFGQRVVRCGAPGGVPVGTEGTVMMVDDRGTVCINWDDSVGRDYNSLEVYSARMAAVILNPKACRGE